MRWLDSIGDPMDMNLSKRSRTGNPGVLHSMTSQRVGHDLVTEQQLQQQISQLKKKEHAN